VKAMKDEVIQELWRAKDAIAARFKHDPVALVKHLRARERRSSSVVVDLHASRQAGRTATK
jgi:hypothetical protein